MNVIQKKTNGHCTNIKKRDCYSSNHKFGHQLYMHKIEKTAHCGWWI